MAKALRGDSEKWRRRSAGIRAVTPRRTSHLAAEPLDWTPLDVAYHIAAGYKHARPHWGKDWVMLVELAAKLGVDLSDLWTFAYNTHTFAYNTHSSPGTCKRLVMLPMDVVWSNADRKDVFGRSRCSGAYVWAQVPKGEGKARLRMRIEAARAEIHLLAKKGRRS